MNKLTMRRTELPAGVVQLELSGEIDFAVSNDLTAAQMREIDAPGVTRLIVDLREVTFLDSTGISALVAGYRAAHERGIGFLLTNPHHMVRSVLQVTGVLGPLTDTVQPPVDDARAAAELEA